MHNCHFRGRGYKIYSISNNISRYILKGYRIESSILLLEIKNRKFYDNKESELLINLRNIDDSKVNK